MFGEAQTTLSQYVAKIGFLVTMVIYTATVMNKRFENLRWAGKLAVSRGIHEIGRIYLAIMAGRIIISQGVKER